MKITGRLGDALCPSGPDCPSIHDTEGDQVIVQGDTLTDTSLLDQLAMPDHESAVLVPRSLIYPTPMGLGEMLEWILDRHTVHLLRIENRRAYAAASDGGDFARYLDGAAEPLEGAAWHERLRASTKEGRTWTKLHVVHDDTLSPYESYEFEWGFTRTTRAGELVRVLSAAPARFADVPDFWVVDHEHVVRMVYDATGKFAGAHTLAGPDAAVYRALSQEMWACSTDFDQWWEHHPEAHRQRNSV